MDELVTRLGPDGHSLATGVSFKINNEISRRKFQVGRDIARYTNHNTRTLTRQESLKVG